MTAATIRCGRAAPGTLLLCLLVVGCAASRPALYPNEKYNSVGQAQAERDIDDCMARAQAAVGSGAGTSEAAGRVARDTTVGAAGGAAVGTVAGAIGGNGAGEGAAVGAASGAVAGLFYSLVGLFQSGGSQDPVFQNFVTRCLQERGYEPIGWK
jgi:outer membrane lipoprotein SlyB